MGLQTAAERAPYSFDVARDGDKYKFTYNRSRYGLPVLFGLCVIIGLPLWLVFYWMAKSMYLSDIGFGSLYTAMFCTVCVYLLMNRRRKGRFAISKTHFSVNGRDYDRNHVLRIFVRQPENRYDSATLVGDIFSSVADTMLTSNYSICFSYGESRVKLAGGLSEVSAQTMLNKINQILNDNL